MTSLKANYEDLLQLFIDKCNLMKKYRTLAQKQVELIVQSQLHELAEVLNQKQEIINMIDDFNSKITSLDQQLEKNEVVLPEELQEELIQVREEIRDLTANCKQIDDEQTTHLEMMQKELKGNIEHLRQKRMGVKAYAPSLKQNDGMFIDKRK